MPTNNTNAQAQTATNVAASRISNPILKAVKIGFSVNGKSISDLLDMSTEELRQIGIMLESQIAAQTGTSSHYATKKADKQLTFANEVVSAIYDDRMYDEAKAERARLRKLQLEAANQRLTQIAIEKYANMTEAQAKAEVEKLSEEDED